MVVGFIVVIIARCRFGVGINSRRCAGVGCCEDSQNLQVFGQ